MDGSRRSRIGWGLSLAATVGVLALVVGAVLPASGAAPAANGAAPGQNGDSQQNTHRSDHVFVIMLENHAADHTIGDPAMPYLTSLAGTYGQATNYYGVTHPSEPNYIAATSGDNWDVNNDNPWPANQYDHTNIVDELEAAHIPWAAYMDGMPTAGYLDATWPDSRNPLYSSKHNPFSLYTDVRNNDKRMRQVKPYTDMAKDLNGPHAPRYVWISPDQCNDLHGGVYGTIAGHPEAPCPYSSTSGDTNDQALKAKADAFLRTAVGTITHSRAWTGNSAIFVVADETDFDGTNSATGDWLSAAGCCDSPVLPKGDPDVSADFPGGVYGGGLAPMVVVTSNGPRHVTDATAYNHYSMLLTIEEGFGLGKLGNTSDSRQVKPMWPLISRHS